MGGVSGLSAKASCVDFQRAQTLVLMTLFRAGRRSQQILVTVKRLVQPRREQSVSERSLSR